MLPQKALLATNINVGGFRFNILLKNCHLCAACLARPMRLMRLVINDVDLTSIARLDSCLLPPLLNQGHIVFTPWCQQPMTAVRLTDPLKTLSYLRNFDVRVV